MRGGIPNMNTIIKKREDFDVIKTVKALMIGMLLVFTVGIFSIAARADIEADTYAINLSYRYVYGNPNDLSDLVSASSDEDFDELDTPLTIQYGTERLMAESFRRSWIDLDSSWATGEKDVTILHYPIPMGYESFLAQTQPLVFDYIACGFYPRRVVSLQIPLKKTGEASDLNNPQVFVKKRTELIIEGNSVRQPDKDRYVLGKEDEFKPVCIVSAGNVTLREGVDYYMTYKRLPNPNGGSLPYEISIHGIGTYTGVKVVTLEYYSYPPDKTKQNTTEQNKTDSAKTLSISKNPSINNIKVTGTKVTLSWNKLSKKKIKKLKIKSIQVQVAKNKSFKKLYKTGKAKKTASSWKFKGKKKTTYYVRCRYVGNNGYSKWSKAKKVRIK